MTKDARNPGFRNIFHAKKYLFSRYGADSVVDIHESPTSDSEGQFFYVTRNGALIGRGLSIDEAVIDAERHFPAPESGESDLFGIPENK